MTNTADTREYELSFGQQELLSLTMNANGVPDPWVFSSVLKQMPRDVHFDLSIRPGTSRTDVIDDMERLHQITGFPIGSHRQKMEFSYELLDSNDNPSIRISRR